MPPVELPDAKGVGPAFATEPPPPLGERNRRLIEDGGAATGCLVPQAPGPSRRIKELPVAISEHAYFLRSTWLGVGFDLLRTHAEYKRDYLLPRLNQDGLLERKPASYADAMVATAGLLSILGLPLEVQGYWTCGGSAPE